MAKSKKKPGSRAKPKHRFYEDVELVEQPCKEYVTYALAGTFGINVPNAMRVTLSGPAPVVEELLNRLGFR